MGRTPDILPPEGGWWMWTGKMAEIFMGMQEENEGAMRHFPIRARTAHRKHGLALLAEGRGLAHKGV
jgi:hypothetical protein